MPARVVARTRTRVGKELGARRREPERVGARAAGRARAVDGALRMQARVRVMEAMMTIGRNFMMMRMVVVTIAMMTWRATTTGRTKTTTGTWMTRTTRMRTPWMTTTTAMTMTTMMTMTMMIIIIIIAGAIDDARVKRSMMPWIAVIPRLGCGRCCGVWVPRLRAVVECFVKAIRHDRRSCCVDYKPWMIHRRRWRH